MRNPKLIWLTNGIKTAGGTPPTYLTDVDLHTRKVTAQAKEAPRAETPYIGVVEAWTDAVLEDRDPVTDPAVLTALLNSVLHTGDLDYAAANIVEQRAIEALEADAHDIAAKLKQAADAAGQELTKAHAILGDVSLDEVQTIFGMGPEAVAAHQAVTQAKATLRTIDLAWVALAEFARFTMVPEYARRMSDLNLEQWQRVRGTRDPWEIVRVGGTIDLAADQATVLNRQRRVEAEARERVEAPAQAEREQRQAQGAKMLEMVDRMKQ